MRAPLEWLAEYCDPGLQARDLAERLAMTGTEVDRISHHGVANLEAFVVGRVLATSPHPDADRLTVCTVEIAGGEQTQIVCGAPNVAAGQTVAIARPGAIMPDGTKLKKAKLRGVSSDGMILAEDELAISSAHDETIVLSEDGLVAGQPLAGVLPIATEVLELEITPNRPDCLGVYGVAREVHAATGAALAAAPWEDDPALRAYESTAGGVGVEIVVEATDLCPRFTARAFEDVKIGPSPVWLKARLMAAGQRPINNVVDITNYVMLLTGQPLHAFDLDRIAGGRLVVRRAADGEQVVTLDGQTRVLDAEVCLIADADGPTSIAGVMGGTRSEVQPDTTRVLMEVASWDGPNIHAHVVEARPAQRGQRALREGAVARAGARGAGGRDEAHARADRRAARAGHDRRRRPRAGCSRAAAARRARERAARRADRARARARCTCGAWASSVAERAPAGSTSPCRTGGASTSRARPT